MSGLDKLTRGLRDAGELLEVAAEENDSGTIAEIEADATRLSHAVEQLEFQRMFPGNKTRLKYGYVVECTGCEKDANGKVTAVLATLVPDTKSGTPGADAIKVKGNITWVAVADAVPVEVRLYERLFAASQPGSGELLEELNSASLLTTQGYAEPSLSAAAEGAPSQFERHGYFVLDAHGSASGGRVFNRTAGMRDSWGK